MDDKAQIRATRDTSITGNPSTSSKRLKRLEEFLSLFNLHFLYFKKGTISTTVLTQGRQSTIRPIVQTSAFPISSHLSEDHRDLQ
jgi:hypothetical protein